MDTSSPTKFVIDQTTVLSLLATVSLLTSAYLLSIRLLPSTADTKHRILFIWLAYDALVHFCLEGSFVYNCFFSYTTVPHTSDYPHPAAIPATGYFLGHADRLYGSQYGSNPMAKLWQEYAKADKRWGRADLTVISIELLTVLGAGPLTVWVCELLRRGESERGRLWFWSSILATMELYGGFMTFAPEWLSGNTNLDTSNFMYLWVYLFFFNMLWVAFPLWILYEAHSSINLAFARASGAIGREAKKNI